MARRIQEGRGESRIRGVARAGNKNKWRAYLQLHLGIYDTPEDAGRVYAEADALFRGPALKFRREHEPRT